jgi:hypothetical protein
VGDIRLSIFLSDTCVSVRAFAPKWASRLYFTAWPHEKVAHINVFRCGGEDHEGLALVQALVSGDLGQSFHRYGLHWDIRIHGCAGMGCSSAGPQSQIWALLQVGVRVSTHVRSCRREGPAN